MGNGYQFSHVSDSEHCGVVFYDARTGKEIRRVPFPKERKLGKVQRVTVDLDSVKNLLYQFYDDTERVPDQKGRSFLVAKKYGEEKSPEDFYAILDKQDFDWKGTKRPMIPYEDCLIYCLHVRGFSKHASSAVKARGTFGGIIEKIPYLKSIGVTTLEFQPAYEFIEKKAPAQNHNANLTMVTPSDSPRLNYWGYTEGFYFAPKADYAVKDPVLECKEMIRALHEEGMEAVFQFYFPPEVNPMRIPEILRFWVEEYHVDGFHLIGENLPADLIARVPELSDVKLWYYQFQTEAIYGKRTLPGVKNLGLVRDDFLYEMRRFLKGDENLIQAVTTHLRAVPAALGRINYLSTYWGFTLMDAVSYDFKHNEANGEENHDGTDYNCSWNCGEEGPSRKKKIRDLRIQQIKNAYCLLFLSQGTPRIFMGDEFGNSQKGNNNPYCQDNEVTWLNWKNMEKNHELLAFFRMLVTLRKSNPVLHPAKEAQLMDSISCGYPDLSFHGETAWRPQFESYVRHLGVAYCGLYGGEAKKDEEGREEFLYLAVNMHWEPHKLGLPRLQKGQRWTLKFATAEGAEAEPAGDFVNMPPKTVALYVSRKEIVVGAKDDDEGLETL